MQSTKNPVVAEAIDFLGGDALVARRAGLKTAWAVSKWRMRLPAERTLWLAKQTGFKFSPHVLNADMYPNATDGIPARDTDPGSGKVLP